MRTRCEKEDRQRLSSSVFVPRLVLAVGSRENAWTHAHNGEREREREISPSLRHRDEGTGGERSPAGRSTFRSRSCETCSPPRWAPPSPSQDRGGPRSRCSPLPPTLSCGRSSTGHPCLRGPVNRPPPRNRPAACDPSSSVCSSASTIYIIVYSIFLSFPSLLFIFREKEKERDRVRERGRSH